MKKVLFRKVIVLISIVALVSVFCIPAMNAAAAENWVYRGETTVNPTCSGDGSAAWNTYLNGFLLRTDGNPDGANGKIIWGSNLNYKIVWRARTRTSGLTGFRIDGKVLPALGAWSPEYETIGRGLTFNSNPNFFGYQEVEIDYVKVYFNTIIADWYDEGETTVVPTLTGYYGGVSWDSAKSLFVGGGQGSGTLTWGSDTNYKIVWRARCIVGNISLGGKQLPFTTTGWSQEYTTTGRTLSWSSTNGGTYEIDYVKVYSLRDYYLIDEGETTTVPEYDCYGAPLVYDSVNKMFSGAGVYCFMSWGSDDGYKLAWRARGDVVMDGYQLLDQYWSPEYITNGRGLDATTGGHFDIDYVNIYRLEPIE